jgi:hypothetical protein
LSNPYLTQNPYVDKQSPASSNNPYIQQPSNPYLDNQEESLADKVYNVAADVGSILLKPASAALDAISYLDKPRGAIAGTVKAYQDDTPLLEGAKKGWQENTSWKETFNQDWVKENPTTAAVAGFATDVLLDPLNVITPAKIVAGAAKGSKAVGLTDNLITPAVNAAKGSERGQKAIAALEDWTGINRVQEAQDAFRAGRASDMVKGQDIVDEVQGLKKQYGDQATVLNDYIQGANRGGAITPQTQDAVLNSFNKGKLLEDIKAGTIDKPTAFDTLRDVGEEIPDYLLQEPQRVAKKAGQSIPDYAFRDEVLSNIPEPGLRKAIQIIGDKVIDRNLQIQNTLSDVGRLGDEAVVRFQEGSHLRRAIGKYENPEQFLEALRKNGTPEEWRRAYKDLADTTAPGRQGFGRAHSVDVKEFTQRQVLSEDTLRKLGEIKDPEYKIMDTLNRASKTIREDEFLRTVDNMFGKSAEEAADLSRTLPARRQYVEIPEGKAYGALSGKWVPKDVANQIMGTMGTKPDNINATLQKMVSWWKVEKLASPSAIARNFYSGIPMANVFGKVPFQSMPKQMFKISKVFSEQGKNAPILRELRETGILGNVWNKQELRNIIGENPTGIKKVADKAMEAFGAPDKFWRAVVYSYHREEGKTIKEAADIANRALFDYSQAPDIINSLSRSGLVPFAKFPYFATKETAKALYERPAQVTKYTKLQNQDNTADREKILPEHLQTRQLLPIGQGTRIVNGKEQKVQNNIDLNYILPFANDISLGNPLFDAAQLIKTGRNGLGQEVIKPGMTNNEKAGEYARYAWNSLGPSFPLPYNYAGEKLGDGLSGNVDRMGRQYSPASALAQVFAGVKNVPINVDEVFKQNMSAMSRQRQSINSVLNDIKKDQRLSKEEKQSRIKDHENQIKELGRQMKEAADAYKREKKRGAI